MEKSVVTIIASSSGLFPPFIHEALLSFCNCGSRWKVLVTGAVKSDWNPITRQGTHVPDIYQAMMALCHFQGVTNTYRTWSPHHGRPAQRNLSELSYSTRQWGGKGGNISASLSLTHRGGDTSPENRLQHLLLRVLSTNVSLASAQLTWQTCRGAQLQVCDASQEENIAQISKMYVVPYISIK